MVKEADLNILVSNVISEINYSHCRLCLKDIEDNFARFEDCVSFNPEISNLKPVSEILTSLLGSRVSTL